MHGFNVYITTGNLLKKTCSKKSLKICCCPLLLTTTICIVAVVAATITTSFLLNNNSSPFFVNTTFNSTVVVPLKKFTKQFTITSTRKSLDDYSCTLASITLPCNDLSKSYLKNQSVDDISNDLGNLYMYLLRGSVMHFRFDSYSNCPSYTLWIFPDKLNNQVEFPIPCTSLNEHKLKGKCNTFAGSGTFDYTVPKDAYYFYVKYNCEQGVSKLSLTIDYYWYNFTQYVNNSGVQAVYIPPGKHWVIAATSSFSESFSRMCTLIQTPNIYDCRALHSFESSVYISQITLYPEIWVLCIMPVVFVSLVVFIGTLLGYTLLFIKEVKKGHIQPQ